jgi:hypothetical protein
VPFALNAYADVPSVGSTEVSSVVSIEVPSEEEEPMPPSYERAGLAEQSPIDSTEIVRDATSFRASSRELRALDRRARAGEYVLPVDASLVTVADLMSKHHDYPAADLGVSTGSNVYAAHAGTVRTVTQRGKCGRGVVIDGADGYGYVYCHGSEVLVEVDEEVKAGERIMFSGNTGHSTGPHLHFGIETSTGAKICPQSLLSSWYAGGEASPDEAESRGCFSASPEKERRDKRRGRRAAQGTDAVKPRSDDPSDDDGGGSGPTPTPTPIPSLPAPTPTPTPTPTQTLEPAPAPSDLDLSLTGTD